MRPAVTALFLSILAPSALAQVTGAAFGFAAGTTGGGNATPQAPSSLAELKTWLSDSTPRVILINREWNFKGSEGTTTGHACRGKERCGAQNGGQDTIKDACDANENSITATWDNAGRRGLTIGSNKSIVGVGSSGVIRGKGVGITGGASNIIIQNIHFTDLNPQFVWGGDILGMDKCDRVWIDHNKFSLAGRQFIVSGFNPSGGVTISNNEFDGRTSWSSACNGKHNWGVMLVGSNDRYTFANNHVHDMASRSPKIGQTVTSGTNTNIFHGYNNFFRDISGNAFDIDANTDVLLEADVFQNVVTPFSSASSSAGGRIFNTPNSGSTGTCSSQIGRNCLTSNASATGTIPSFTNTAALSAIGRYRSNIGTPRPAGEVASYVQANAGVGKVSGGTNPPPTTTSPPPATTQPPSGCSALYGQCGGQGWTGPTCCASGSCKVTNEWYSQCL